MVTIFFLAAYLNAGFTTEPTTTADATSSIIIGGTASPNEVELADASVSASVLDPGEMLPGDKVQVVNDSTITRLYSDANHDALVMDQLTSGEFLIVIEPSSEYDTYPVENEGKHWIRVRAVDGLVGWVDASTLTE